MECVFCDIIAKQEPASVVHEDEALLAIMDQSPLSLGYVIVFAKHTESVRQLMERTWAQMNAVAQATARCNRCLGTHLEGFNFMISDGAIAGQDVPHAHLHLVPRSAGDGLHVTTESIERTRLQLDKDAAQIRERLPDNSAA
jgi:histidine triad (HIT) family protein